MAPPPNPTVRAVARNANPPGHPPRSGWSASLPFAMPPEPPTSELRSPPFAPLVANAPPPVAELEHAHVVEQEPVGPAPGPASHAGSVAGEPAFSAASLPVILMSPRARTTSA